MNLPKSVRKIVIILANLMDINGNLNDESIGRAKAGSEYFIQNNCDLIITCGWPYRSDSSIYIADAFKKYIVEHYPIPAERIYSEKRSRDTVGDAVFTKLDINEISDVDQIIVATSDYHAARTEEIFRFIFGSKIKITVIEAKTSYKDQKLEAESKSLQAFRQTFLGIQPGNDQQIFARLTEQHPFYNGQIYPKIESKIPSNPANILFLGYSDEQTKLIRELKNYGCNISWTADKIATTAGFDAVVSFGYRHILTKELINSSPAPIINLHISFLPYNRGAHPNFWSFFDKTPSGVSIHLIDDGIDTGPILFQRQIEFTKDEDTFSKTYDRLVNEIENLFVANIDAIVNKTFIPKVQTSKGTYHRLSDLPKEFSGWNSHIQTEIKRLHQLLKK